MSNFTKQTKKIMGVLATISLILILLVMIKTIPSPIPANVLIGKQTSTLWKTTTPFPSLTSVSIKNKTPGLRPTITAPLLPDGSARPTAFPLPTNSVPFNNILTKTVPMKGEKIDGKIFLRDANPYGVYNLLRIDTVMSSAHLVIKNITGSPDISLDGKMLVIGCSDANKLCIFNVDDLTTINILDEITPLEEFNLPVSCIIKKSWGVQSLSWSQDSKKIAIVCGDQEQSDVFILDTAKEQFTQWKQINFPGQVRRAVWSPIKNILVISFTSEGIYQVDSEGGSLTFLSDGESPAWSPDGSRILYFRFDKEREFSGIAMMNADGSNQTWLHRPISRKSDYRDVYEEVIPACNEVSAGCRLSWSPDGDYAVFSATTHATLGVFRIDIKTGEIIFMTDPSFKYSARVPSFAEPVWIP